MKDLFLIAVAAATVNNIVLVRLLGLCPVVGTGTRLKDVRDVGLATTGVLAVTGGLSYLLERWVLVPYGLPYLRIIGFLALTLLTLQLANLVIRTIDAQLPLITINCLVLGVALLATGSAQSLAGAVALGFGAGVGFSLVLLLFTSLRPRLEQAPIAPALRGPPIALITVGIMALAVLGFAGFGT